MSTDTHIEDRIAQLKRIRSQRHEMLPRADTRMVREAIRGNIINIDAEIKALEQTERQHA